MGLLFVNRWKSLRQSTVTFTSQGVSQLLIKYILGWLHWYVSFYLSLVWRFVPSRNIPKENGHGKTHCMWYSLTSTTQYSPLLSLSYASWQYKPKINYNIATGSQQFALKQTLPISTVVLPYHNFQTAESIRWERVKLAIKNQFE